MGRFLSRVLYEPKPDHLWFYCPGCQCVHGIKTGPDGWTWNGNAERPTFMPSLLSRTGDGQRCHLYVRDGQLQFLDDSTHALAGQTVLIPDFDS